MQAGQPALLSPVEPVLPRGHMKIIFCFFIVLASALCSGIWKTSLDTKEVYGRIKTLEKELSVISKETKSLDKYTDEDPSRLEDLYPEIFCDIKEISAYYYADCEIKIFGGKTL